jgi:hypothetical protein
MAIYDVFYNNSRTGKRQNYFDSSVGDGYLLHVQTNRKTTSDTDIAVAIRRDQTEPVSYLCGAKGSKWTEVEPAVITKAAAKQAKSS